MCKSTVALQLVVDTNYRKIAAYRRQTCLTPDTINRNRDINRRYWVGKYWWALPYQNKHHLFIVNCLFYQISKTLFVYLRLGSEIGVRQTAVQHAGDSMTVAGGRFMLQGRSGAAWHRLLCSGVCMLTICDVEPATSHPTSHLHQRSLLLLLCKHQ